MKKPSTEKKSWGTVVAEKERAKANSYTGEKRQRLMARGLQLIYGDPALPGNGQFDKDWRQRSGVGVFRTHSWLSPRGQLRG
jgi:hypothetical protein